MQEKYTKKAFDVLQRAKEAAAKLGNEYIGTEHILLGLTLVQQSVAAKALEGQNVTYHQVMERICACVRDDGFLLFPLHLRNAGGKAEILSPLGYDTARKACGGAQQAGGGASGGKLCRDRAYSAGTSA